MQNKPSQTSVNFRKPNFQAKRPGPIKVKKEETLSQASDFSARVPSSWSESTPEPIHIRLQGANISKFGQIEIPKSRRSFLINTLQSSLAGTPRNLGATPRNVGDTPRNVGDTPRSGFQSSTPKAAFDSDYIDQFREYLQHKNTASIHRKRHSEKLANANSNNIETHESTYSSHHNTHGDDHITEEKNRQITNTVKKIQSKIKYHKTEKSINFNKKLAVFKDMATFIDIKDYLSKLNTPEETQLVESLSHAQTPRKQNQSTSSSKRFSNFAQTSYPYTDKLERLKEIKAHLTEARKERPKQFLRGQHQFQKYLGRAEDVFKTYESGSMTTRTFTEKTDEDEFYSTLEGNLRKNKFDKVHYEVGPVEDNHEEYLENLKRMLVGKDGDQDQDEYINSQRNQMKIFKDRSNKVISMLQRASKNIFRKTLQVAPKKSTIPKVKDGLTHRRVKSEALPGGLGLIKEEEASPKLQEDQTRSGGFFLTDMGTEPDVDHFAGSMFANKFDSLKKKIHRVSHSTHFYSDRLGHGKESPPPQRKFGMTTTSYLKDKSPDYAKNKKVTTLFEKYSQDFLREVDHQKEMVKTYRTGFGKLLDKVGLLYERELAALDPKPLSELQIIDYKSNTKEHIGSFLHKPLRVKNAKRVKYVGI